LPKRIAIDEHSLVLEDMTQTQPTFVAYTGSSMRPIFKPGDLLEVLPYEGRQVRCGDVIFFSCPRENCKVVHRVVDLDAHGIRTKGDNNEQIDSWVVTPQQVVGYVVRAQRGRRWRRITGGCVGRLAAKGMRAVKRASEWTTRIGFLSVLKSPKSNRSDYTRGVSLTRTRTS